LLIECGDLLLRVEQIVVINIYFQDELEIYKLVEQEQIFKDGRVRHRNISTSIGEKMKQLESPIDATKRALKEELGIQMTADDFNFQLLEFFNEDRPAVPSVSFPGLWTKRNLYFTEIYLPKKFYRPDGYMEIQSDKSSYFVWQKVD
jgi:hypothetical protein